MFPDFPIVKERGNRLLLSWTQSQIPLISPLLRGVSRTRQYEGATGEIIRPDASSAKLEYPPTEFEFVLSREEMKEFDLQRLQAKLLELAKHFADSQKKQMLQKVSQAAESVGNVVDAQGKLTKEHILEMFRRVQMDFDPVTGEPRMPTLVAHPDTIAKLMEQAKEWEKDPEFLAEHERIMETKKDEWNARESNRKLVD